MKFVGCLVIGLTVTAWIDVHNMADKISCREKSKTHINAASIYGQWKSGKIYPTGQMCSLNLAVRGHRETSHNGVCEGGNFLAIVALMAQYDEVLAEVFSLLPRAVKYLNHGIQEELISLIGTLLE